MDPAILRPGLELTYQCERSATTGVAHDAKTGTETGDLLVRGWMTTTQLNSYRQRVHASTFDWDGGLSRWNGRILLEHGRRFLVGGGDGVPIGRITTHKFVKNRGMYGSGFYYKENDERLKRAVRDGTMNDWSIGFELTEDGYEYDEKKDILDITKGILHELSTCNVGACPGAKNEVLNEHELVGEILHHAREEMIKKDIIHQEPKCRLVTWQGRQWLVTSRGDWYDV